MASADPWNDRTTMTFTSAVTVPGATLEPGTYVFRLVDLRVNRHLVRIMNEDESEVIALANAVPVKRQDPEGTTQVTFAATSDAGPPVLKAWYYPGTLYGHEFLYSSEQAREIAVRSKTLVLSDEAAEGIASEGQLRVYDADGSFRNWEADEAVVREWTDWTASQTAKARSVTQTADETTREATAPMIGAQAEAMTVDIGKLEENPNDYIGKTISVSAEVQSVLGPRLFTIDEPHWFDLDGEVLVHMPTALATLVREEDRVTITGTMRPFVEAEVKDEWSWFDDDEDVALQLARRPVLVASRVVGGDDDRALFIAKPAGERTASDASERTASNESSETAGMHARPAPARGDATRSETMKRSETTERRESNDRSETAIADLMAVNSAAIGRAVDLDEVKVDRIVPGRGFIVSAGDRAVFVRRADGRQPTVQPGDMVALEGFVLSMPPSMRDHFRGMAKPDGTVFVYATNVES